MEKAALPNSAWERGLFSGMNAKSHDFGILEHRRCPQSDIVIE
jgi:hypothetical protein